MHGLPRRCIFLAVLIGGCRSLAPQSLPLEDINPSRAERKDQAVRQFEAERSEAQLSAARSYWQQGQWEDCQRLLEAILAREPERVSAALLLAEVRLAANQPERSIEVLHRLVENNSLSEQDRLSAAILALRSSEPHLSVELIQAAPPEQTASPAALQTLAIGHYRCGNFAAADSTLHQALVLDNASPLTYFLMGCTQARLGRNTDAAAAFEQAARLDERFQGAQAGSI